MHSTECNDSFQYCTSSPVIFPCSPDNHHSWCLLEVRGRTRPTYDAKRHPDLIRRFSTMPKILSFKNFLSELRGMRPHPRIPPGSATACHEIAFFSNTCVTIKAVNWSLKVFKNYLDTKFHKCFLALCVYWEGFRRPSSDHVFLHAPSPHSVHPPAFSELYSPTFSYPPTPLHDRCAQCWCQKCDLDLFKNETSFKKSEIDHSFFWDWVFETSNRKGL